MAPLTLAIVAPTAMAATIARVRCLPTLVIGDINVDPHLSGRLKRFIRWSAASAVPFAIDRHASRRPRAGSMFDLELAD
jgi:hypothetical protein